MILDLEKLHIDEALEALSVHGHHACAAGGFEGIWGLVHIGEVPEEDLDHLVGFLGYLRRKEPDRAEKLVILQAAALELERRRRLDAEESPAPSLTLRGRIQGWFGGYPKQW